MVETVFIVKEVTSDIVHTLIVVTNSPATPDVVIGERNVRCIQVGLQF